jgi:multiple antibiotic resistance protein
VISLALLLFLIMDPFGNMVAVNSILSGFNTRQRTIILWRETAIATGLLIIAVFAGAPLLRTLGLDEYSLRVSGGIVLFLIALGMVFPSRRVIDETVNEPPLIVPIAMPLIAGPSAISMVILFAEKMPGTEVAAAVLIASTGSGLVLSLSAWLYSVLGIRGARALERLIGMVLIMLSVQMILDGIDTYLQARL